MSQADEIIAQMSEPQRKLFLSRKKPNDYAARDALALERLGLLVFTPMGDVVTSPLGVVVRNAMVGEYP